MEQPLGTTRMRGQLLRAIALVAALTTACSDDATGDAQDDGGADAPEGDAGGGGGDDIFVTGLGDGCDLSGSWASLGVTFTTADTPLAPGAQKTSAWSLVELEQDGDEVTVVSDLPCGIITTGAAVVNMRGPDNEFAPPTYKERTKTTGRVGTSVEAGGECEVAFERLYTAIGTTVPGAEPPGRIDGNPALDMLPALIEDDAEDWDEDGNPGVTFIITETPIGSGTRSAIQRGWSELAGTIAADADEFMIPVAWALDDLILASSSALFATEAVVRQADHVAQYRRVDRDAIVGDTDVDTCTTLREALPYSAEPADSF